MSYFLDCNPCGLLPYHPLYAHGQLAPYADELYYGRPAVFLLFGAPVLSVFFSVISRQKTKAAKFSLPQRRQRGYI